MNSFRKFLTASLVSMSMFASGMAVVPTPVLAAQPETTLPDLPATSRDDAGQETKDIIANLIYAYGNGDHQAVEDDLARLQEISPDEWYPVYQEVVDYWDWIESDMPENLDQAPEGIEDPAHHCFIVLGFALNDDGTMTDELVGRLSTAKASLDEYPESYVLVTGGVEKNGWTEGQRMHDWLIENGIDEGRIFVENKAPDTAGNATNSFEILYDDGNIDSVSLIASQYHLKRGSILYFTEDLLKAKELGQKPIAFLGDKNAGWKRDDKTSEPMSAKANSMYSIARVEAKEAPELDTDVTDLDIIFDREGGNTFNTGEDLDVVVKTIDSKGMNLTVTDFCTFSGYDSSAAGEQTVHVVFTNNGSTIEKDFTVIVSGEPLKADQVHTAGENDEMRLWGCMALLSAGVFALLEARRFATGRK